MEKCMSRILVETVVKNALRSIADSPERGTRNLIDMASQFSNGRFQKKFFTAAQTMLQNEGSAYYALIRNIALHTDTDRLFTFGMNLGYNSCTEGANRIRRYEAEKNCNIPWSISLRMDMPNLSENLARYGSLISEGEDLGIYTWMLFPKNDLKEILPLAKQHPDCAFFIFCETGHLSQEVLEQATKLYNIMLVVHYEDGVESICSTLCDMGFLYSVWYRYGQQDTEIIINGDLFSSTEQLFPAFTVLIPDRSCPEEIRNLIYQTVNQFRNVQSYSTVLWELQGDNRAVDSIISGDAVSVAFDENGSLCDWNQTCQSGHHNLFQSSLADILTSSCPKGTNESV